ncbi:MAG: OB-fold nucleic acid binding domain-containing protein, partial [Candidatus Aenigmarchaeota archaeon]|nr:OB-fold nucleic acid binding domain-containing protein [Candidatus Aenigmarchaeota archaeon]MDI6722961.1 OB-fold nucleic acid binding domain-containing protein [Candidatus Aenigmarchaeota archaeon]
KMERLNIGNIVAEMQNADIIGKIVGIAEKEFGSDDKKGRLMSIIIGDETGTIRVVLWNDEIEKMRDFREGDTIQVRGSVKDGMFGPEIRVGKYGAITRSSEIVTEAVKRDIVYERSAIKDMREGQYRQIRAPIVQVFEGNIFYEICPICKGKSKEWKCPEHGDIQPDYGLIISGIADDGTGNMRIVAFNDAAEKVIGMSKFEAKRLFDIKKTMKAVTENIRIGKDFLIEGKVSRNALFDRLEFVVNDVKGVDTMKEIEMLMDKPEGV